MASSPPPLITLDDTNPAIVYQPASLWRHLDRQDSVMNNTYAAGYTNATATLVFNGTEISVYGVVLVPPNKGVPVPPPLVTFIMDGEPTLPQGAPLDNEVHYAWLWYRPSTLEPREHTLVVHVDRGDNKTETAWPWVLDYIQYTPLSSDSATQTRSLSQPTDATPSITAESSKGTVAVGPIAGGVVGGIAGLVLLTFAAFVLFKRRKRGEARLPLSNKEVDLLEQGPKAYVTMHSVSPPTAAAPSTTAADPSDAGGPGGMRYAPSGPLSTLASLSYENLLLLPAKQPHGYPAQASTTTATSSRSTTPGPAASSSAAVSSLAPSSLSTPHSYGFQAAPSVKSQGTQQEVPTQGTAATPRVFHTDSGVRFTPPAVEETSPQDDARSDMAFSEVPPEYTEH